MGRDNNGVTAATERLRPWRLEGLTELWWVGKLYHRALDVGTGTDPRLLLNNTQTSNSLV